MFLLAGLRCSNRGGMADPAFDSQLLHEVQKPMHRSGRFDTRKHRAWKLRIKLPHLVAFDATPLLIGWSHNRFQKEPSLDGPPTKPKQDGVSFESAFANAFSLWNSRA